jgi:PAS domain S-box-containing protein
MPQTLRVLIVEDSEDDTALLLRELRRGPWEVSHERVDTPAAMSAALDRQGWDLIIADYSMPQFSGPAALALAAGRAGEVPFILISGVVSEDIAVLSMKAGADDYLSKENFARLVPAVERELHQAAVRGEALRIEQQLRRREAHLADALQLARVGTWHLDIRTNTALWSDEACRIVGFNADQAPAFENLLARLDPKDRSVLENLLRDPATKQFAQDLQIIRADGVAQFVQIRGDILRDGDLMPLEAAGTIQDVTQRKRLEQAIQEKNTELEAANLAKDNFLASMSHELRTPLNAIIGFTGTLLMRLPGPLNPDQEKQLRTVQRSGRHLLSLINDLLDLAKIESGKVELNFEPVVCQSVLDEVNAALRPLATAKSLALEVLTADASVTVRTDRRAFMQIVLNLANNAIKFTETGRVVLKLERGGANGDSFVAVRIIDTGIGIRPKDQARLFQAFEQIAGGAHWQEGTGLGLHLSQKLANLLGGRIEFTSEFGQGSTFTFTLKEH